MAGSLDRFGDSVLQPPRLPRVNTGCAFDCFRQERRHELGLQIDDSRLRRQFQSEIRATNGQPRQHDVTYHLSADFVQTDVKSINWHVFNERILSPNQKSTILRTGVENGGQAEWDFAYNQYTSKFDTSYLVAVARSRDTSRLNTFVF